MEVRTISTEIIKPSSPTPPPSRLHKLSLLDQLTPDIYGNILLFYSALSSNTSTKTSQSNLLKKSLSQILTRYYPFAGRVNDDNKYVDCDDSGAVFIETHVAKAMSEILNQPEMDKLEQLSPCKSNNTSTTRANLRVQVNYFDCGGVAISVCLRHAIADASAATNFIKNWAAIARGGPDHCIVSNDVVFDCSSIFPPQDLSGLMKSVFEKHCSTKETIRKRFTFDGAKIAALREKIKEGSCNMVRPTRFEAVSTLILGAVIAAVKERDQSTCPKYLTASIPVNLRKRMNPPFPEQCIGNIYQTTRVTWPMEKTTSDDYKCLAAKLQESIRMINDNYVRKLYEGGAFLDNLRKAATSFLTSNELQTFGISGWCRFPICEADFGWGKPIWVSTTMRLDNTAVLLDSCDAQGIEAWAGLSKEDMDKFERNPDILTYATLNPSI